MTEKTENKFAVVGLGGVFPGAENTQTFWENILEKRVFIERLPQESVERDVFFRPEVIGAAKKGNRSYTDLFAPCKTVAFEPKHFRIPPKTAAQMDWNQKLGLIAAEEAIEKGALRSVSNDRVSVVMGNTMIGTLHHDHKTHLDCDAYEHYLTHHPLFADLSKDKQTRLVSDIRHRLTDGYPMVTEDTAPGVLPNIIAARINAVFDLHGPAYVVDAACASGLAAIICGISQLRLNEADAVICGAADKHNVEIGRVYFSAIGALSAAGSFPFDVRADGFVLGDGAGVTIIKRLEDAIIAGDEILAVISGFARNSDGKGKAVAAPNPVWQAKTIGQAWQMAEAPANTIELIEAHGTGTKVGDQCEVSALKQAFDVLHSEQKHYCGIGSVKSNIGHLKSAASIAGFIKAVLALKHKTLPPTAGLQTPNPALALEGSPFYLLNEAKPWEAKAHPRRAGVSAFGFGGADFHIALEEYRAEDYAGVSPSYWSRSAPTTVSVSSSEPPRTVSRRNSIGTEPLFFSGKDESDIISKMAEFAARLQRHPEGAAEAISEANLFARSDDPARLGLVFASTDGFWQQLEQVKHWLPKNGGAAALSAKGIAFETGPAVTSDEVAVLFPGQGSQYGDLLRPIFDHFAAPKRLLERADRVWERLAEHTVSEIILTNGDLPACEARLKQTEYTHPAVVTGGLAMFTLLKELGVHPRALVGHSVGELTALIASGRLSFVDGLALVHARAHAFFEVPGEKRGGMAALRMGAADAERFLVDHGVDLVVANHNGPSQTIVSGRSSEISKLLDVCRQNAVSIKKINVSCGFHSPLMTLAEARFSRALASAPFRPGTIDVMANRTANWYGPKKSDVVGELSKQITGPVCFDKTICRLHDKGVRVFIEAGPGSVLSNLVRTILKEDNVRVISTDRWRENALGTFQKSVAALFAAGLPIDPTLAIRRQPEATSSQSHQSSVQSASTGSRAVSIADKETTSRTSPSPTVVSQIPLVYSGVAVGLPGSYKETFRDDNFEQLFSGRNFIERLTDEERASMVDLSISKVVKSAEGASFKELNTLNEVIQLAGKMGALNLHENYGLDEKDIADMSGAIAAAVAAGYEALRDAHIPLVHTYSKTESGSFLPDRWSLPREMQAGCGVIFANGFPMVEPIIEEVSRHLNCQLGNRAKNALFELYDSLIDSITDKNVRQSLLDWYAEHRNSLVTSNEKDAVYRFNYRLMTRIAMQANNRLARYINARGPNFQINAACSSAATAVTLAESLIRAGKATMMIVIGGDDPTSKHPLPYLGGGFLSTGACTNCGDIYEAAAPFDKRRNGMIMGAGGVGIVIESDDACAKRGISPVAELLGTHCFNAAGHGSQLDIPRYAEELERFMTQMESQHGLERKSMADKLVYMSHETYTPARGGCAEAEAVALQYVFQDAFQKIEVGNTKGMTGHTMGASIEDAAAAKSLQFGQAPPVVNYKVADPALKGLNLSKGVPKSFEYALRTAAGFGSQGNYILLKKRADKAARIVEPSLHAAWLKTISNSDRPRLIDRGRVLAVANERPGAVEAQRPSLVSIHRNRKSSLPYFVAREATVVPAPLAETPNPSVVTTTRLPKPYPQVEELVFQVISEVTGYDRQVLDDTMDLEADLGIDTVKQATVLSTLAERLSLSDMGSITLSEYPTIGHLIGLFSGASRSTIPPLDSFDMNEESGLSKKELRRSDGTDTVREQIFQVISEVTGYETAVLDVDMDLEADLGVDTVKQATVLSALAERFALSETDVRLSDYPTIRHLVDLFNGVEQSDVNPALDSVENESVQIPQEGIREKVVAVVAEVTGYAASILEPEMELEADLGIDTVKQATIWSMLADAFEKAPTGDIAISAHSTIADLCAFLEQFESGKTPAQESVKKSLSSNRLVESGEFETPTHRSPKPSHSVRRSRFDIMNRLRELVETASPYPKEMLAADVRLGDVGLAGNNTSMLMKALKQEFGVPATIVEGDPSLDDLCDLIWRYVAPDAAGEGAWIGRQLNILCEAPLTEGVVSLKGKRIWVLGDEPVAVCLLSERLKSEGGAPMEMIIPTSPKDVVLLVERALENGAPDMLVDLTAVMDTPPLMALPMERGRSIIERAMITRFVLAKQLQEKQVVPRRVLVITGMDGSFGLSGQDGDCSSFYGLYTGFYKSIRKVWDKTRLSILDLAKDAWRNQDGQDALEQVVKELTGIGLGVEVGYVNQKRCRVTAEESSWDEMGTGDMGWDEVVVATGGGGGITSEIVCALAKRRPAAFALIGRTPLDPDAERLVWATEETIEAEKQSILHQFSKRQERVTPVRVNAELSKRLRSAAVFETLETLQTYGSKADYFEADVCEEAELSSVLGEIRHRFGPITTLIHGAGIEVSSTLENKSEAEFSRVHRVKTIGAYHLIRLCFSDPLRRLVFLSSIAGRFGSPHQVDYAAGNGFLDTLARTMSRPGMRTLSLICSAWQDKGMAWRNSFIREHASSMGLGFIPLGVGAALAAKEIVSQGPREVILHRGLGDVIDPEQAALDLAPYPLVDWVAKKGGRVSSVHRQFSPKRDLFLDQHRLGDTALMPGVACMEMMVEAACLAGARRDGAFGFRNLAFLDALKFHKDRSRELRVDLMPSEKKGEFTASIHSLFVPSLKADPEVREYCRAELFFDVPNAPSSIPAPDMKGATRTTWAALLEEQQSYRRNIRLGPLFNEARRAKAERRSSEFSVSQNGFDAVVPFPQVQMAEPRYPLEQFLINLAFLDTLHQAGAISTIMMTDHVYLPVGADEFIVWHALTQDALYRVYAAKRHVDDQEALYDMAMVREDGMTMATVKGSRFRRVQG